jgi:C1A family cysteine protease
MLTAEIKPTASDKTKLSAWRADTRNSWGRSFGENGFHYTDLTEIELETYGCGIFCDAEVIR